MAFMAGSGGDRFDAVNAVTIGGRDAIVKCSFGLQSEMDRIEDGLKSWTTFDVGLGGGLRRWGPRIFETSEAENLFVFYQNNHSLD